VSDPPPLAYERVAGRVSGSADLVKAVAERNPRVVFSGSMSEPLATTPDARRGLPIRTLCVQVLEGPDASLVHRAKQRGR